MVVDDEPMVASAIRRMLAREHDVIPVTSAREAKDRLRNGERFDLILCDLNLPDMSGMDVFVRAPPEVREKFVFATGGALTEEASEFLKTVKRLDKPFRLEELERLLFG
jgi:CheY-like chemotaxis protein